MEFRATGRPIPPALDPPLESRIDCLAEEEGNIDGLETAPESERCDPGDEKVDACCTFGTSANDDMVLAEPTADPPGSTVPQ